MQNIFRFIIGLFFLISLPAFAESSCAPDDLAKNKQQVLACYLAKPEHIKQAWVFENKTYDAEHKISIETYTLNSLTWPQANVSKHSKQWQHRLIIYRPDVVKTEEALLFVDGGTRYDKAIKMPGQIHFLDFDRIATATQSVVIDLKDIPNQYISFDDEVPRREDGIIAYSWNRYMDNPQQNLYWPAYLPMTKVVIKAMDASQEILAKNDKIKISHFVVSGASKRGLTTWLAALSDQRINGIVPIVIDILNIKKNIQHIYASYGNHWPPAFHDYVEQKVSDRINSPEFASLMKIDDPIAYLECRDCDLYRKRLSLPKYIISASGDDFFVPDSMNLYLSKLPGSTQVRVVPNQSHFIDLNIVEDALISFQQRIIHHQQWPTLQWKLNSAGELQTLTTSAKPLSVKLWEAVNPKTRDFRLAAKITYTATTLKGRCIHHQCQYPIKLTPPEQGWKSSFVEVSFAQPQGDPLVLTTPAYVKGSH